MSAPQFTPGPWMRDGISVTVERPAGEKRQCVAITSPHTNMPSINSCERMKANARLIAAAPELYVALDTLVRHLDERIDDACKNNPQSVPVFAGIAAAHDALNKARGEQVPV